MRDLILKMSISVDGFVGGPDGELDRLFFRGRDPVGAAWVVETLRNASLHIMGSRTFTDMAHWWPTSTEVFAPAMNEIPKAVFSRRGPSILKDTATTAALQDAAARIKPGQPLVLQPGAESWTDPYVASGDLVEEIARLKAQDGKPIVAHGGARFARSLVAAGLIDRYHLVVQPVVLGKGLALFSDLPAPCSFELVSSTAFPAGAVALVYRPA